MYLNDFKSESKYVNNIDRYKYYICVQSLRYTSLNLYMVIDSNY